MSTDGSRTPAGSPGVAPYTPGEGIHALPAHEGSATTDEWTSYPFGFKVAQDTTP